MENEEKAKVILDYDKYQELLAKANLNEKTIQQIKNAAYKEGLSVYSRVIKILNEV